MSEDREYIRRFCDGGDPAAFAELVRRHIDLVWAAAYRITGNPDMARDVAQTVFCDLARKGRFLSEKIVLAGWLHRAASFAACRAVRDETRRRMRERLAMEMQSLQPDSDTEEKIKPLLPLLDEAIAKLRQKDREAILLRYFGKKSLAEIGVAFGISEDAAQKRLTRALDRLRLHFRRSGLETSAAFMAMALGAAASQAAPAGVAAAVAAGSLSAAGAASATLIGYLLAYVPSSATLMKTPVLITALVVATVSVPLVYQEYERSQLTAESTMLQAQASELPYWREVHAQGQAQQQMARELMQLRQGHDELVKLRAEAEALNSQEMQQKLEWQRRLEMARARLASAQASTAEVKDKIAAEDLRRKRVDDLKQLGLAARIFATRHRDQLPKTFEEIGDQLPEGLNIELYEFVEHGRPISESEPHMILLREKEPRRLPEGKWTRAYTFVDGSVQQAGSDTADFRAWERPFIAPPSEAQKAASTK